MTSLLDSYGKPTQRREGKAPSACTDTMGAEGEGTVSEEKHSPERAKVTFQTPYSR